ncbi:MAG: prepilin-type N-terminal cleavage/methylation domain-containing protein [Nitrospirota bacterium]
MINKKGFTLIELLIIIAIIGILVGIAATGGMALIDKTNVTNFIKQMNADFMDAQVSSMQRSRMHFIVLTPTSYTIFEDTTGGPNGDGILNIALDRRIKQVSISQRYAMTIPPLLAAGFNFTRRGNIVDSFGNDVVVQQNFRVTQNFNAPLDCIAIIPPRTRAGVWDAVGGTCRVQ